MEAYCVKCKTKRELNHPEAVYTANGAPGTRGACPVCTTALFRMGATPAHESLPKPERVAAPRKSAAKTTASKAPADKVTAGKAAVGKVTAAKPTKSTSGNGKASRATATAAAGRYTGPRKGKLVIVESPAKAKTVGRYLGAGYTVKASVGHVRDLYKSKLSVDLDHDFKPLYSVSPDKKKIVRDLADAAERAEHVYLATDPDREGEAIAWHVAEAAGLEMERTQRVVFHEITKNAVGEAFAHPRPINMELVNAQQARRILDRLVGYKISPLLWKNVRKGLSAGRVQSVALRLIVEREREIEAFVSEEYWSITAELAKREAQHRKFKARLVKIYGEDFRAKPSLGLNTQADAQGVVDDLQQAEWQVSKVQRGERVRRPAAPFTTSTLQQEASRRLGYNATRTMRLAQDLYEGVALGEEGSVGLITYMRTDSTNVSAEAQAEARDYIVAEYGGAYVPEKPPVYRTKARSAQEAHEAIRPTSVRRTPASVKSHLAPDQLKLYTLIWQRFVASQMTPAIYDTLTVEVEAGPSLGRKPYLFRATGSSVRFPGFLAVYEETRSEDDTSEDDLGIDIPPLTVDELVDLLRLIPEQHFTEPPPRFTEATLVKALEEHGIGRPSTYASIISTILDREYVRREAKRLHPTPLGSVVNDLLVAHFDKLFEVGFTSIMEEDLDRIANGDEDWVQILREFYAKFEPMVEAADTGMQRQRLEPEKLNETCPQCGVGELVVREGRYGRFVGCARYPECKFTRQLVVDSGVACPKDGGRIIQKRSKKGRVFYGCENWPGCDFVTWNEPLPIRCPRCNSVLTKNGNRAKCANSDCGYSQPLGDAGVAQENVRVQEDALEMA